MKAVRIHKHGGIDVLKYDDISPPNIRQNQCLVKIKAAALNHLDIWVRKGIPGVPLPMIMGSDGAGFVEKVGAKVSEFSIGDRVLIQPLTYCGTCRWCTENKENYCEKWGIFGENQDGTQCEYMAVNSDRRNEGFQKPHNKRMQSDKVPTARALYRWRGALCGRQKVVAKR